MDLANLENYAWIYGHEDDWDQGGVLLETWFLADYDIQMHCLEKVLWTLVWCFWKFDVFQIRVKIIYSKMVDGKKIFLKIMIGFKQWNIYVVTWFLFTVRGVPNWNYIE